MIAVLLGVAHDAVGAAAAVIRSGPPSVITAKGDRDPVTDVDLAVERVVRDLLAAASPGIGFLGEEEGRTRAGDGLARMWVLDPIDGTVNYCAGSPLCAVSLALFEDGQPVLGVIDLPFLGERYWATTGGGAFLNGDPLRPAGPQNMSDAIVAMGDFATGPDAAAQNALQVRLAGLLAGKTLRIRMLGSAAIDLAWLAAERHHASITLCNRPWDVGAGVVIAQEAGAAVVDLDGSRYAPSSQAVVAASGGLVRDLLETIDEARGQG